MMFILKVIVKNLKSYKSEKYYRRIKKDQRKKYQKNNTPVKKSVKDRNSEMIFIFKPFLSNTQQLFFNQL